MVARDQHDLAIRSHRALDRPQDRFGKFERLARTPLGELEHIAEQHQSVDPIEGVEQQRQRLGMTQDVAAETATEVQIGDDEGAHVHARVGGAGSASSHSSVDHPKSWAPIP